MAFSRASLTLNPSLANSIDFVNRSFHFNLPYCWWSFHNPAIWPGMAIVCAPGIEWMDIRLPMQHSIKKYHLISGFPSILADESKLTNFRKWIYVRALKASFLQKLSRNNMKLLFLGALLASPAGTQRYFNVHLTSITSI